LYCARHCSKDFLLSAFDPTVRWLYGIGKLRRLNLAEIPYYTGKGVLAGREAAGRDPPLGR